MALALLLAYSGFDDSTIDFQAPFDSPPVTVLHELQRETFHLAGGYYRAGIIVRQMAKFDRAFDEDQSVQSAAGEVKASGTRLTFDDVGMISSGKVQMIHTALASGNWNLLGMTVAGASFTAALNSADTGDDHALMAAALGGNDRIILSAFADQVHAGAGRDLVMGWGGADTLYGEGGIDVIDGGKGADSLYGGAGNDQLYGDAGRDTLDGGAGDDFLFGGGGLSEVLTGGLGHDSFVLAYNFGSDFSTVTDFEQGTDHIRFQAAYHDATGGHDVTFADLTIRQTAAGAMVKFANPDGSYTLRMLLQGVEAATLTAADFAPLMEAPFQHSNADFWTNWVYWTN